MVRVLPRARAAPRYFPLSRVFTGRGATRWTASAPAMPAASSSRVRSSTVFTWTTLHKPLPPQSPRSAASPERACSTLPTTNRRRRRMSILYAAELLGAPPPPEIPFEGAGLSPMARSFYIGNKRIRNDKIKRELGVVPQISGLSRRLARPAGRRNRRLGGGAILESGCKSVRRRPPAPRPSPRKHALACLHLLLPHPQAGADGEKGRSNHAADFGLLSPSRIRLADAATLRWQARQGELAGRETGVRGALEQAINRIRCNTNRHKF